MFCHKCGAELMDGAIFCQKCGEKVLKEGMFQQSGNTSAKQFGVETSKLSAGKSQNISNNKALAKNSKRKLIFLGILAATVLLIIFIALNWEGKIDYVASVKAHTPFAVSQDLPYTYEEVLTEYFDSLEWKVREEGEFHYVDIKGTVKEMDTDFALLIKISANLDNSEQFFMRPESITLGDRQFSTEDEATDVLYNLFSMYDEGYGIDEILESLTFKESFYAEYEETARQIIVDWFERHSLMDNIRVQFMDEIADIGERKEKYLVYEMDWASGEEYGIFLVNPDNGDMIMDSLIDSSGKWAEIQVTMDQWYLEYYWGWTDDSGYYSENYSDDLVVIYDETGCEILGYSPNYDAYVIYNFDGQFFIEYDDGSEASEINIMDFAGTYGYDGSFEEEGTFANFYYLLEIGAWDGYCFSIAEEWRGNTVLQDEYARPKSLIVDTLTFDIYNPDSGEYETHSLVYIPAKDSPLKQDTIYLDDDDTMPFARE